VTDETDAGRFVNGADEALYESKKKGRNRVTGKNRGS
jgi:PleD family two-component response regulator